MYANMQVYACFHLMYLSVWILCMQLCALFVNILGQHKGMVVYRKGGLTGSSNFLSIRGVRKEIEIMHLPSRMQWTWTWANFGRWWRTGRDYQPLEKYLSATWSAPESRLINACQQLDQYLSATLSAPVREWKLTFYSPVATAELSKFADILSAALSQHHLSGFEIAQLEFYHLH